MTTKVFKRVRPKLPIIFTLAAVLTSGTVTAFADSPYAIRDPKVPKNLSPKARAQYQRTAAIKQKQEVKKAILEMAKGEKQNAKTK